MLFLSSNRALNQTLPLQLSENSSQKNSSAISFAAGPDPRHCIALQNGQSFFHQLFSSFCEVHIPAASVQRRHAAYFEVRPVSVPEKKEVMGTSKISGNEPIHQDYPSGKQRFFSKNEFLEAALCI